MGKFFKIFFGILFFPITIILCICKAIVGSNSTEKDSLDSWQRDLVNNGENDETSFEEEELEEDDFYHDDID